MFGLLLRKALANHGAQEALVRSRNLDWIVVRPAAFADGPRTGNYKHGFSQSEKDLKLKVSRADVVDLCSKG
ncbi:MAG: putative NADH-flavin reductase [Gammaproteobacteria bacterium]|jgi:putative NADH-flavin reductase